MMPVRVQELFRGVGAPLEGASVAGTVPPRVQMEYLSLCTVLVLLFAPKAACWSMNAAKLAGPSSALCSHCCSRLVVCKRPWMCWRCCSLSLKRIHQGRLVWPITDCCMFALATQCCVVKNKSQVSRMCPNDSTIGLGVTMHHKLAICTAVQSPKPPKQTVCQSVSL